MHIFASKNSKVICIGFCLIWRVLRRRSIRRPLAASGDHWQNCMQHSRFLRRGSSKWWSRSPAQQRTKTRGLPGGTAEKSLHALSFGVCAPRLLSLAYALYFKVADSLGSCPVICHTRSSTFILWRWSLFHLDSQQRAQQKCYICRQWAQPAVLQPPARTLSTKTPLY